VFTIRDVPIITIGGGVLSEAQSGAVGIHRDFCRDAEIGFIAVVVDANLNGKSVKTEIAVGILEKSTPNQERNRTVMN
jgi:hypothetical protein